jgi:hypothetical protein
MSQRSCWRPRGVSPNPSERSLNSAGTYIDHRAGRVPLSLWAERWLDGVRPPTLKPKTLASYESLLRSRIVPAFGRHPVGALKPSEIQAWVGAMVADGVSASRIRQAVVVLRQILDAAQRDRLIGRNPPAPIKCRGWSNARPPTSILTW